MSTQPAAVHQPVRAPAAVPAWRWWVAGSFLARLPLTMVVIALVLSGRRLGSYGLGAGLSGIFMVAAGAAPSGGDGSSTAASCGVASSASSWRSPPPSPS